MEDVVEEPVIDIDNCDSKDPLAVVEYIDDLYKFYKKAEVINCSIYFCCFFMADFAWTVSLVLMLTPGFKFCSVLVVFLQTI